MPGGQRGLGLQVWRFSGLKLVGDELRIGEAMMAAMRLPLRSGHKAYLDGWRGICILLVIFGHFTSGLGSVANAGVEFFFVLSGALMAELLVFQRQDIARFLRRRIARVGPAIAAYVILIGGALNAVLWIRGEPLRLLSPTAALFFFHNYLPHSSVVSAFEHSWSLAVEEHSYLLLALIVFLTRRRPWLCAGAAVLISLLAIANAYRLLDLPYDGGQFIQWRSDVRVASVLMSFALCIAIRETKLQPASWVAPISAVAALPFMISQDEISPLRLFTCTILAAVAVNSLHQSSEFLRARLASPALVWLGTLSFSIYVWQQLLFIVHREGVPAVICIPVLLGCALLSFKLVEDPARNYLNAQWGAKPGATAALTPSTQRA